MPAGSVACSSPDRDHAPGFGGGPVMDLGSDTRSNRPGSGRPALRPAGSRTRPVVSTVCAVWGAIDKAPPPTGRNPACQAGPRADKKRFFPDLGGGASRLPTQPFGGGTLSARPGNADLSMGHLTCAAVRFFTRISLRPFDGMLAAGRMLRFHPLGTRCPCCPVAQKEAPLPGGQEGVLLRSGVWCVEAR